MYHVYRNQAAAAYSLLYFFIFLSLQFSTLKFFVTLSWELWGLEDWKLVHTWTVGRCIVYTGIRLLLLIHPFISLFFFLSNFQTLKFFVRLFSGSVRPRRLKLGTQVESGQMYRVYRNAAAYSSLYFFIFLSLQLSNIKNFRHIFRSYLSLYFFIFFLSNFQTLKSFVTLLSGTVRPRRLKLGTHVDSGWMYRVYQNQNAAAYSSLYFFFFLQYSNIKNFRHIFLRNCET